MNYCVIIYIILLLYACDYFVLEMSKCIKRCTLSKKFENRWLIICRLFVFAFSTSHDLNICYTCNRWVNLQPKPAGAGEAADIHSLLMFLSLCPNRPLQLDYAEGA